MAVTVTQLQAFLAVADTGGVQAAARHLHVTQPSVSAAVAALEREVGTDLLARHGRGVRLTDAGEAYAPYARRVLGLLEHGRLAGQEAARAVLARVRVACVNTAGEYLLPAVLAAYRRVEPDAEVQLEVANRDGVLVRVAALEADVGVGGRPLAAGVVGRRLLDNELVVVGREPAADLSGATWLLREEGSGTRAAAERYLAERGISPRAVLTLGSNGAVKRGAALGLGLTLISSHAVARELRDGSLARVAAPGTPLHRPWYSLVPRDVPPRPAVERFLAFLHSRAAREAIEQGL